MAGGTYSNNTTLKVSAAVSGATTVPSNSYAIVTYVSSSSAPGSVNVYYGPGQSVTSSVTIAGTSHALNSGVIFTNSP